MLLGALAATCASCGWAAGMMIAHAPARQLGAFEFTRIQLLTSGFTMGMLAAIFGYWQSVSWDEWPAFLLSILVGVILGNLAMVECLRRGTPRETELIGYYISTTLLLYALAHIEAGIAAVLGSLSPVLILPMAWIVEGRRPSLQASLGAFLSVFGCAIIVLC